MMVGSDAIAPQRYRRTAWAAIASGSMGLFAFGALIAFFAYVLSLHREIERLEDLPLLGRLLLSGNYLGTLLQALLMIPVALWLRSFGDRRSQQLTNIGTAVGVFAFLAVFILRTINILDPERISDIWFIGPLGFVGLWLILANWILRGTISNRLSTAGTVAGIGLVVAGLSFFFLLDLRALMVNPDSYGQDLDFHVGLWIGGIPGLILYGIWAILLGRSLLRSARHHVA